MSRSTLLFLAVLFAALLTSASRLAAQSPETSLHPWGNHYLKKAPEWYATPEAIAVAENVLQYQSAEGAWPKNTNLAAPASETNLLTIAESGASNTIDNGATTAPIQFMAAVGHATNNTSFLASANRGIDYLLEAQYPNGGFPQIYPLRSNYSSHITYNDGAMINALTILRQVANASPPFQFSGEARQTRASDALKRGIDCILRTQIMRNGQGSVWCAQHDAVTLEPAWARAFEPPSFSGSESVGIVRFLMDIEEPSGDVIDAVEGAIAWFRDNAIHGMRLETYIHDDGERERRVVEDQDAPPLWARFYELDTLRPLFVGRDRVFHYELATIERERRMGYTYLGSWPASLLERYYPSWRQRVELNQTSAN